MQYYIASWVWRYHPAAAGWAAWLRAGAGAVSVAFPLSIFLLRTRVSALTETFAMASFVWAGVSVIALSWGVFGDCAVLAAHAAGWGARARSVAGWLVPASVLGLSVLAAWNASRMPAVREVEVPMRGLPAGLDGLSVVHLSDLHLGITVSAAKWERIAAQVNSLAPDVLVLDGDFVDPGIRDMGRVEAAGMSLRARLAKVAVLGNHEVYHGIAEAARCFSRCGARLLRNEVIELPGGLQLAGIDDVMAMGLGRADVGAVLDKLDGGKPSIYISHQPLYFEEAAAHGVGLMVSGHTHRGQVFPFGWFVRIWYRYVYGPYWKGRSLLYVSSGTGEWGPPMRLFTRAEIVRFVLRAEKSPS